MLCVVDGSDIWILPWKLLTTTCTTSIANFFRHYVNITFNFRTTYLWCNCEVLQYSDNFTGTCIWNLVQAHAHLSLLSGFPSPPVPGPPTRWQPCGGRNHSTPWRPPSHAIYRMLPAETPPSGGSQNQLQKKEENQMHIVNTGDFVQDRNGVKSWNFLSGIVNMVNKCKAKQNLSVS